jgi:GTP-binding protein SAR1
MFLLKWLKSNLKLIGLHKKKFKLIFLGLDNAGKSALLYLLHHQKLDLFDIISAFQSLEVTVGNFCFQILDIFGHEKARETWNNYIGEADAIIFIVDSADRDRFDLARHELHTLLGIKELQSAVFVIFGNKIDIPYAASEEELKIALGLDNYFMNLQGKYPEGVRKIGFFMCSVAKRCGYVEGLKWLGQLLS